MRSLRLTATAAMMLTLVACSEPAAGPGGSLPDDAARLQRQAADALARWDAAAKGAGATPFVPVGELTDQIGNWEDPVGENNSLALATGNVADKAGLTETTPSERRVQWADGTSREVPVLSAAAALRALRQGGVGSQETRALEIIDARLSTKDIATSRGKANVPVWEFVIRGSRVVITRVAVDPGAGIKVAPPSWKPHDAPIGLSAESAVISASGHELTVHFAGSRGPADQPCGSDYTAVAVESASAVVIIINRKRHNETERCFLIGYERTATATLALPLGNRTVLEVQQGLPIPVTSSSAGK